MHGGSYNNNQSNAPPKVLELRNPDSANRCARFGGVCTYEVLPELGPNNISGKVDETYIRVKSKWDHL
jgi:hypothetical protein